MPQEELCILFVVESLILELKNVDFSNNYLILALWILKIKKIRFNADFVKRK